MRIVSDNSARSAAESRYELARRRGLSFLIDNHRKTPGLVEITESTKKLLSCSCLLFFQTSTYDGVRGPYPLHIPPRFHHLHYELGRPKAFGWFSLIFFNSAISSSVTLIDFVRQLQNQKSSFPLMWTQDSVQHQRRSSSSVSLTNPSILRLISLTIREQHTWDPRNSHSLCWRVLEHILWFLTRMTVVYWSLRLFIESTRSQRKISPLYEPRQDCVCLDAYFVCELGRQR